MNSDPHLQTSLNILEDQCVRYLETLGKKNIWVVESDSRPVGETDFTEDVEIVLFGRFYQAILLSAYWPIQKGSHFWVLSTTVKKMMVELFGFSDQVISVIPRRSLYPLRQKTKSFAFESSEWSFVYGGRISVSKNIGFLIKFVGALIVKYPEKKITLDLYGEIDNIPYFHNGESYDEKFPVEIKKEIEQASFVNWHHKMSSEDWLDHSEQNNVNPIFINFSTSPYEDFGVSAVQAEARGWPSILSQWGGHNDQNEAILIPSRFIMEDRFRSDLSGYMAKYLAENFFENFMTVSKVNFEKITGTQYLAVENLDKIRREMIGAFATKSFLIPLNFFEAISSVEGQLQLERYKEYMGRGFAYEQGIALINANFFDKIEEYYTQFPIVIFPLNVSRLENNLVFLAKFQRIYIQPSQLSRDFVQRLINLGVIVVEI